MPLTRTGRLVVTAAVAGAAAAIVVLAGSVAVFLSRSGDPATALTPNSSASSAGAASASASPAPDVRISVIHLKNGVVPYGERLRLIARDGVITDVSVTDANGFDVPGRVASNGSRWASSRNLPPDGDYTAVVATMTKDGRADQRQLTFSSSSPTADLTLRATVSPDGGVYGVGMPITVHFNHSVARSDRPLVQGRFTVSATPAVVGAWHWIDDKVAHWRPAQLWPAHSTVNVQWDFTKLSLSQASWGAAGTHTATFSIGDSHVSTVDVATHHMVVRVNGKPVRLMPVSTGRPKYASQGGPHIVLSKQPERFMDSATVGIPKGDPDYYYEKVLWDTRISNGGMFVHAAPWSVRYQGRANVSHGCVNANTADAKWFFELSQVGDVVNIINSDAKPNLWDAGTADWTIPWSQWVDDDPAQPSLDRGIPTDPALLDDATMTVSKAGLASVSASPLPGEPGFPELTDTPSATTTGRPSTKPTPTAKPSATRSPTPKPSAKPTTTTTKTPTARAHSTATR